MTIRKLSGKSNQPNRASSFSWASAIHVISFAVRAGQDWSFARSDEGKR